MRVVLDSNVLVSALVGHSEPRRLLIRLLDGHVIISSRKMLAELEDVLSKRKFELPKHNIDEFMLIIVKGSHITPVTDCPKVILEDADDDVVLATALSGDTEYIVTGDRHLLKLKKYKGIWVVTVREMLKLL